MKNDLHGNPGKFWSYLSREKNWIDYILPKRTEKEFWNEGKLEAENIQKIAGEIDTTFVIDYGCGIGRITKYFPHKEIIGIDVCEEFIEKAGEGFSTIKNFKEKEVATFIYCISVLQHNDEANRKKIIDHIHSLLREGGKCFINFPMEKSLYVKTWFVHTFSEEEVRELFLQFSKVELVKGNLARYGGKIVSGQNEIFVIATK